MKGKEATDSVVEQLRPEITHTASSIRWIFGALAAGILGGALAGAGAGFLIFQFSSRGAEGNILPPPITEAAKTDTAPRGEPVFTHAAASVVGIYKNPGKANTINSASFRFEGIPLTSDGWIVAPEGVISGDGVAWSRRWYPAEKIITDPFTGIVFLKVRASGFPLTPFAPRERLKDGDRLVGYGEDGSVFDIRVVLARFVATPDAASPAEKLPAFVRVAEISPGMPIFDSKGELAGMALKGGKMLPAQYIESALKMILKEGKVRRPFFGVASLDRSSQIFVQAPLLGAILASSKEFPAVERGSPAFAAGLKEGDVITAVESFELNQNQTLAEVMVGFTPGTKVSVKYLRGGKEETVSITLGEKN